MRRYRGLRLRRGQVLGGAASSPVPAVPPPPLIRRAGSLRFAARLLPSARRAWGPGWGQSNQGAAFPSVIRQPRSADRRGLRLLTTRTRRIDPPWPQANQGEAWASYARPRPARAVRLRRGAVLAVPPSAAALPPPQVIRAARPIRVLRLPARGRVTPPVLAQGNQGTHLASLTRQAGTRRGFRVRRGLLLNVPPAAVSPTAPKTLLMAGIV